MYQNVIYQAKYLIKNNLYIVNFYIINLYQTYLKGNENKKKRG